MWDQLDVEQRSFIGPLFAEFIEAFLHADIATEIDWLVSVGFQSEKAKSIVMDTHLSAGAKSALKAASRPTVLILEKHGLLNHSQTVDCLGARGLID